MTTNFPNYNFADYGGISDASETVFVDEDTILTGSVISVGGLGTVSSFKLEGNDTIYNAGQTATIAGVGTLRIDTNGSYTFTPVANYYGPVPVVTYLLTYQQPTGIAKDTSTLSITVNPVNDNFIDNDEIVSIDRNQKLTGNVIDGSSVDGPITVTSFYVDTNNDGRNEFFFADQEATINGVGKLRIRADGRYTFEPADNYSGPVPLVTYNLSDTFDPEETSTLRITVNPVSSNLTDASETVSVAEDGSLTGNVLNNTSNANGPVTVTNFTVDTNNDGTRESFAANQTATITGVGTLRINTDGTYTFTPNTNYNGPVPQVTYTLTDGSSPSVSSTLTVNVTPVNDAPTTAPVTLAAIAEDSGARLITQAELLANATDVDGDSLTATGLSIATGKGTLVDNGNGTWRYTPALNDDTAVSFSYTISDGRGSSVAGSANLDITPVNDAPAGTDGTVTILEDGVKTFAASDFGFSDVDGNSLAAVKISSLPANGTLRYNGTTITQAQVTAGFEVLAANLGLLTFVPAANANGNNYTSFSFQVRDNGGTANGGVDLDPTPNTISFNVTAVNDAPAGTDATVTILEDSVRTFAASDFGFSDVDGNSLAAVKISSLPANGTLRYNGVAITPTQVSTGFEVAVANLGLLTFVPVANANGNNYASFSFQVRDNGGTANGGVDLDPTPNTITFNVTPVDDSFSDADETVSTMQGTPLTGNVINGTSPDGPITVTSFSVGSVAPNPNVQVGATGFNEALPAPLQTYFVPIPETPLLRTLNTIQSSVASVQDVRSIVSIAIANAGTVIYYDHWEDGYEANVRNPLMRQSTTQIWGDGDLSNGVAPGEADDIFEAGDAFVLDNVVDLTPSRTASQIFFDGADRIQTSAPIAMTRGAWALNPGSLFASSTEILDTDSWGTEFIVPFGENTITDSNDPLEYSSIYVMASQPNTQVFVNNVLTATLGVGENYVTRVNQSDRLTTSKPVQVNIATGDIGSTYEMRWSRLAPLAQWSNDYYSPVGTAAKSDGGSTKVWLYNPNDSAITVSYDFLGGGVDGTITIAANSVALSPAVPDNSGARVFTANGEKFLPLSYTDINTPDSSPSGQMYEWASSLVPASELTYQAIVGWGYGTTNPNGDAARSVVFVTPTAQTDIWVDYDGAGSRAPVKVVDNATALSSTKLIDPVDQDMTGAIVYTLNEAGDGPGANIAVAWGQDPTRSTGGDSQAIDVGTLVAPLPIVEAGMTARLFDDADGNGYFSPGDTIEYTINIVNSGRVALPVGSFKAQVFTNVAGADVLDETTYIAGSTTYQGTAVADSATGTLLPLDENGGLLNPIALGVGGTHTIKFRTKIDPAAQITPGTESIVSQGQISPSGAIQFPVDTFEQETPLVIPISNTFSAGQTATINGVGTLQINADGTYTFTPAPGYTGPVPQVTYTLSNGSGSVDTSTLAINVTPINRAPTGTSRTATLLEDSAYTLTVADFGFSDPNNTPANSLQAVRISTLPQAGSLTNNGVAVTAGQLISVADINAGRLRFTPAANANGTGYATFTFQVQDDGGTTNGGVNLDPSPKTFTLNVTPVDDSFSDANEVQSLNEDTTLTGSVLMGTSSVDGPVTVVGFSVEGNATTFNAGQTATISGVGNLQINANGSYTFTPVADYYGSVPVVTYTLSDGSGSNDTSTLALTVNAVDDNFSDTSEVVSMNEDTTLTGSVLTGTSSVDGPVSVTAFSVAGNSTTFNAGQTATISGVGNLVINSNGNYTFTPFPFYTGAVPMATYTVTDGLGPNTSSTLTITVNPVRLNVSELYGKPTAMTFTYMGGSVISTGGRDRDGNGLGDQDGGTRIESGAPDNDSSAYIVVSETNNVADIKTGSKKVYFAGTVEIGQSFSANLSFLNQDKFQNDTRILIFEDEAAFIAGNAPLQVTNYKTDGSQPITTGDQIAGVRLVEYQGMTGGYDNPNINPLMGKVGRGFSLTDLFGDAQQLTFRYDASTTLFTGGKTNNQDRKAEILGTRILDDDGTSFIRVSDKDKPNDLGGREFFEGLVSFGQQFLASVFRPSANTTKFGANTYIHYFDDQGGTYLGSAVYKTDGSEPMQLDDRLSGAVLVGFGGTKGSALL
jgi:VCBS repeat-containing protein